MEISVIIPTYNRPKLLLQALRSLQGQTLSDFEILVVDNAADSEVRRMTMEFNQTARVPVRYIPEPQLGLQNARHTGVRAAKSDIVVFTDDDATSDPGWLRAYARVFAEHREMAAAGGPIRLVWEVPPPEWLPEFLGKTGLFGLLGQIEPHDKFCLGPKEVFFGPNMAIRRDVLFEVEGFCPDSFGDIWLADGETGLNRKLWERGMLVGYVPEALVYHHIPPQRMTVEYLCLRMANQGACDMYARFDHGIPHWLGLAKHAASVIIRNGKYWLAAPLLRGTDVRSVYVQVHTARTQSQLKYIIRLMFDQDLRRLVLKKDWLKESCKSESLGSQGLNRIAQDGKTSRSSRS